MDIIGSIDEAIIHSSQTISILEKILSLKFKKYFGNIFDKSHSFTTLGEYLDYSEGYSFKPECYNKKGKYGIVTIKNVKNLEIDDNFENKTDYVTDLPSEIFVNTGDILMSLTGNAGRVAINHIDNVVLNQRVAKIFGKLPESNIFVYCLMKEKKMEEYIMSISNGTSQKNLSMIDLLKTKINVLQEEKIFVFNEENRVILDKIIYIKRKILALKKYKKLLLPLLLNEQVL